MDLQWVLKGMIVVKSELINGRVSIILMINEANNKHYVLFAIFDLIKHILLGFILHTRIYIASTLMISI